MYMGDMILDIAKESISHIESIWCQLKSIIMQIYNSLKHENFYLLFKRNRISL